MNPSQRLGLRVAELRHKQGMTQRQLAVAAGTSYGTIQDIEQGRHGGPRYANLVALAAALGVTLNKLQEEPGDVTWHPNGKPVDAHGGLFADRPDDFRADGGAAP